MSTRRRDPFTFLAATEDLQRLRLLTFCSILFFEIDHCFGNRPRGGIRQTFEIDYLRRVSSIRSEPLSFSV